MNARVIIGEQNIGDATEQDRDLFAAALVEAMENEFPGLTVDYNPLSGVDYEWQEIDADEYWDDEKVEEFTESVTNWVSQNWEQILADTFA